MLKLVIDKLEDVPEALRDYYKETNGKFLLQAEGLKTQADIDKQLQANQAERTAHTETKKKLGEAAAKLAVFGELDPDDVHAKLSELDTLKAAGPNVKAEEIERKAQELATSKFAVERQKLQRDLAKLTTERDDAAKENGTLKTSITSRTIDDAVRGAAAGAKVLPEAVADVLILARNDFKLVEGKVVTEDGRDPAQWVEDSKKSRAYLWAPAKGAGAGGAGGGGNGLTGKDNPFSNEGWNLTSQGNLLKSDPTRANELATLAGTKVGGVKPPAPGK